MSVRSMRNSVSRWLGVACMFLMLLAVILTITVSVGSLAADDFTNRYHPRIPSLAADDFTNTGASGPNGTGGSNGGGSSGGG